MVDDSENGVTSVLVPCPMNAFESMRVDPCCHDSTGRVARLELVRLRGLLLLDVIRLT
jgi:hypothetical protein